MTETDIKHDFETALLKHFGFKTRLRSFLYGNDSAEGPLRDPDKCPLGHWMTERRHGAYADLPLMATLDREHRRIHNEANKLMDLRLAGQADEARAGFAAVQKLADHITGLFDTLQQQARGGG